MVDGTLIESWAAVKSMRRCDGRDEPPGPGRNPAVDFHGERRSNETHVAPHVAANDGRKGGSTLDGRTTRHAGYTASQRLRKRVEEIFGWCSDWDDRSRKARSTTSAGDRTAATRR